MLRAGYKHVHDANAALPAWFCKRIAPGEALETWAEGLSMFHNPSALHPIDRDMFPGIAHHFLENEQIVSLLPEFHPYCSYTWNVLPELSADEPHPDDASDQAVSSGESP